MGAEAFSEIVISNSSPASGPNVDLAKRFLTSDQTKSDHFDNEYGPDIFYPPSEGSLKPESPKVGSKPRHSPYKNNLNAECKNENEIETNHLPTGEFLLEENKNFKNNELPPYDQFVCEPSENHSTSSITLNFFTKTFKLFSFFIFGSVVFLAGVTNKACLIILINAAKPFVGDKVTMKQDIGVDALQYDVIRAWAFMMLLFMALFPEIMTMCYSLYRIVMKHESSLEMKTVIWRGLWKVLHCIGEGVLLFKVLPFMDVTTALILILVIDYVAIIVHFYAKDKTCTQKKRAIESKKIRNDKKRYLTFAIIAFIFLCVLLILRFAKFFQPSRIFRCMFRRNGTYIWALLGIFLTSFRYLDNLIDRFNITKSFITKASRLQKRLNLCRFHVSFLFSLIKCSILTGMAFFVFVVPENGTYFVSNGSFSSYSYLEIIGLLSNQSTTTQKIVTPIIIKLGYVLITQAICSVAIFYFGQVACLTGIQKWSYTFSILLVTPFVAGISGVLGAQEKSVVEFMGLTGCSKADKYFINWNILLHPTKDNIGASATMAIIVVIGLVIGWLSTVVIILKQNQLERTGILFFEKKYSKPFIDQLLVLSRRLFNHNCPDSRPKNNVKEKLKQNKNKISDLGHLKRASPKKTRRLTISNSKKLIPNLYLCATMWHETEQEMTMLLTSMMRLDKDQGQRRANAQKDPDYYNFEIHLMFDDAMEHTPTKEVKTNRFAQKLCELIPLVANKEELDEAYNMSPPIIYPTPYGGRLKFVLPHGNLLIVHLKDKDKIRHRKRWSQCMYMYYILGYVQAAKKLINLENLFFLALDGDMDFQPDAVLLLLDQMKKNPDLGAACGRIHPKGSGPVIWFQKFEYAVGHFLQKTAEHVLGCVLCCPGCFSVYRGMALADVNVINQYTKPATKPWQYVQWDLGEDRWLCTLLLKQGWRIEYSAASDSFTFAPEDFKEFYNQRRRWVPSTMANIFDILLDAKYTVKNNTYISWVYIGYQFGLMASAILGPAKIILIITSAFQSIFNWDAKLALFVSLMPVIIFIAVCYTTSADTQVTVAGILTVIYSLVMMGVIVWVVAAIAKTIILDPNALFMIMLVGLYVFTGIVHPQEMVCLIHGILYYICVPSAFILLIVYSLTNMHNVSWGTREVKSSQTVAADAENKKQVLQQQSGIIKQKPTMSNEQSVYKQSNMTTPITSKSMEDYENEKMLYWSTEGPLKNGTIEYLDNEEQDFWKYLIDKYLYPLNENKQEKARITGDLTNFRNKTNGAYFLANALWLGLNFTLQLYGTDNAFVFYIDETRISVNPVFFAFFVFVMVLIVIQFICMVAHRWSSSSHLSSASNLK